MDYDHNDRGELIKVTSNVNNNTYSLPDHYFEVSCDDADNRKEDWRNVSDTSDTCSAAL